MLSVRSRTYCNFPATRGGVYSFLSDVYNLIALSVDSVSNSDSFPQGVELAQSRDVPRGGGRPARGEEVPLERANSSSAREWQPTGWADELRMNARKIEEKKARDAAALKPLQSRLLLLGESLAES